MKKFKKIIILSIIIISIVIYLIYNHTNKTVEEIAEEDIYLETEGNIKQTSKIILHITGEVNNPRYYRNRRRFKTC